MFRRNFLRGAGAATVAAPEMARALSQQAQMAAGQISTPPIGDWAYGNGAAAPQPMPLAAWQALKSARALEQNWRPAVAADKQSIMLEFDCLRSVKPAIKARWSYHRLEEHRKKVTLAQRAANAVMEKLGLSKYFGEPDEEPW